MTTSTMNGERDRAADGGGGDTHHLPEKDDPPPLSPSASSSLAPSENQSPGAIVQWEHFNLGVDDNRLAYFFFSEALGLTFDSMTSAMQRGGPYVDWYNIGRQQFHICGKEKPQRFQGRCHLVLPNLKALLFSLERHSNLFQGTSFHVEQSGLPSFVNVTCPWGNSYRVWQSGCAPAYPALARSGLMALELWCPAGSSHQVGRFYQRVLSAQVLWNAPALDGTSQESMSTSCAVRLGVGPLLIFREIEREGESGQATKTVDQGEWHIAIYTSDFENTYSGVKRYSEIDNDHPFSDKCYSFQDALLNKQFRIKDIHGIDENGESTGVKVILRHEVRSMFHPRFNSNLVNKPSSSPT